MEKSELIFKVLSQEASDGEISELEAWIKANLANKSEYEDIKILWENMQSDIVHSQDRKYSSFQNIRLAIKQKERKKNTTRVILAGAFLIVSFIIIHFFSSVGNRKKNPYDFMKFDHTTLLQISSLFKEKYNMQLYIPAHLQTCEFTGTIYNQSVEGAIKTIVGNLGLEYSVINQHSFSLNGTRCIQKTKTDLVVQ